MSARARQISKFLSLVLRHEPQAIGLSLDAEGWVDVDRLLDACRKSGREISLDELRYIVASNDKQRFVMRDGRIRASQGHSIPISLGLSHLEPPRDLYHGTAKRSLASIRVRGLLKMKRQHVHLSSDIDTALSVGRRHGNPVVLRVEAGRMARDGHLFFLSENGVWLTEHVPWRYLEEVARGD